MAIIKSSKIYLATKSNKTERIFFDVKLKEFEQINIKPVNKNVYFIGLFLAPLKNVFDGQITSKLTS